MLRRLEWLPPDKDEDGNPVPPLQFPHGPEHVANLVVFLASEASDHITGETIPIRALLEFDR
jgi:NAD(P)-dependent dehydrogenase (short-subunit alcohol dehydrogenase family)